MTAIEVEGLVKRYDGRTLVDDVSFTVQTGEIVRIVGPNGPGRIFARHFGVEPRFNQPE